ncbi:GNAT family N-acetyltransferase, partial [Patescibacteria group bacterium]|nr:GNAT family N-acetyltransferase [Patescibacteria group bacterium]
MESIKIKLVKIPQELIDAKDIRRQIFQKEQGISEELDFDGKDKKSHHVVVYYKDRPIGTTRIRYLEDNKVAKIERTSVLQEFRGKDIGKQIIEYALDFLNKKGIEKVILNAQEHAKGFYEKLGFKQEGEIFKEASIP